MISNTNLTEYDFAAKYNTNQFLCETSMDYDPFDEVFDETLHVNADTINELIKFRGAEKLKNLPGINVSAERERFSILLNELIDQLVVGLIQNPTKLWVMRQFQKTLEIVRTEDTEIRDHFGLDLETVMDILAIESSDGILSYYLGGI
jgi:hypothetical protein